jgi:hypothetical protein
MKLLNLVYDKNWVTKDGELQKEDYSLANVVFVFGDTDSIKDENRFFELKNLFPNAKVVGCSSSGNIFNSQVTKFQIVATAIAFDKATVEISTINFNDNDDIEKLSEELIDKLPKDNLKHIFLMSDGLLINGSQLKEE